MENPRPPWLPGCSERRSTGWSALILLGRHLECRRDSGVLRRHVPTIVATADARLFLAQLVRHLLDPGFLPTLGQGVFDTPIGEAQVRRMPETLRARLSVRDERMRAFGNGKPGQAGAAAA